MKKHLTTVALFAALISLAAPASAAVIVITHSKALAGGITPPDTPGYPVTLSLPGAYRLDTNLTVPSGKNGIQVTSAYVDIDMNGFRLWGWNAIGIDRIANNGVYSIYGVNSIRNGKISGFRFDGIRLAAGSSESWVVEDMQIVENGGSGIEAFEGSYHRFSRNSILRNADMGILCGDLCSVTGSNVSDNQDVGVFCGENCHIEGNLVHGNDASGIVLDSGTVLGNTVSANAHRGIVNNGGETTVGFGNNTLLGNGEGETTSGVEQLHPNHCFPGAC